jgi:hypothetical protein
VDKFILPSNHKLGLLWQNETKSPIITGGHHLISFMTNGLMVAESCPDELRRLLDRGDAKMIGCFNGAAQSRGIEPGGVFTCRVNAHGKFADRSNPDDITDIGCNQLSEHMGERFERFERLDLPPEIRPLDQLPKQFNSLEEVLGTLAAGTPESVEQTIRNHPLNFIPANHEASENRRPTVVVLRGVDQKEVLDQLAYRLPDCIGLRPANEDDITYQYNDDAPVKPPPRARLKIAATTP